MFDAIAGFFSDSSLLPHGYCLAWQPGLLWTLVIANSVIGLSYISIAAALVSFVRRQQGLKFDSMFLMFGMFIFACGATHFVSVANIWSPIYRLDAAVLVATAVVSLATAMQLWPLVSKASVFLEDRKTQQAKLEELNALLTESLGKYELQRAELADREQRLMAIVTHAPIGQAVVALDGHFLRANQALSTMLGYGEEELLLRRFQDITWREDLDADVAHMQSLLDGSADRYTMEKRYIHKAGHLIWIQLDAAMLRDANGRPVNFIAQIQDITRRKQAEEVVRDRNAQLGSSLARLTRHNEEIKALGDLGETLQACEDLGEISAPIRDLAPLLFHGHAGVVYLMDASGNFLDRAATWGSATTSEPVFAPKLCWAIRKGEIRWSNTSDGLQCRHLSADRESGLTLCVPMFAQGDTLGLLYVEVAEADAAQLDLPARADLERLATMTADRLSIAIANVRLSATLRQQSVRDPLTGQFNRRYLEETLPRELALARRKESHLAVLVLDVDHFKSVNDRYGHDVGDHVLKAIGVTLGKRSRASDLVCRYGGEEFVILLPVASLAEAVAKADQLRNDVREITYGTVMAEVVTISVGIAIFPDDACTADGLLKAADTALYAAKEAGRDRIATAHGSFAQPASHAEPAD